MTTDSFKIASALYIIVAVTMLTGCQPPSQSTCPTARLSCECFELESRTPVEDVTSLIEVLRDLSDPALQGPIAAAADLEGLCGQGGEGGLPLTAERNAQWRGQCSQADLAIPHILRTLESLEGQRGSSRGYRAQENTLAVGLVSALGVLALGNPESPCRRAVVDALIATLEMSEEEQDLRVNATALRWLGELGDPRAAPALVVALFVRGERRRLDLEEAASLALQQLEDPSAAAAALARAGRLDEEALGAAGANLDPREVKSIVAQTLGRLGVADALVVGYLMSELRHSELDEVDRAPATGRERYTPETSRARRRSVAARALGRLGHEAALDVILPRLALREDGSSVDPTVHISSVPDYLDALGNLLRPDRTELPLLNWLTRGDPTLQDIIGRRLTLQGTDALIPRLREVANALPACRGSGGCIRRSYETLYLPALLATAACDDVESWAQHLGTDSNRTRRERAAAQLVLLVRRDPASRDAARRLLVEALLRGVDEATDEVTLAIDRLSPEGANEETRAALESSLAQLRARAPEGHETRRIAALLGRLRARSTR